MLKHEETKSFIPLFREPGSIEQILGETDQLLLRHTPTSSEQPITPPRPISEHKPNPLLHAGNYKQQNFDFDGHETLMPKSSKSTTPVRTKQMHTSTRTPPPAVNSSTGMKYSKWRASTDLVSSCHGNVAFELECHKDHVLL